MILPVIIVTFLCCYCGHSKSPADNLIDPEKSVKYPATNYKSDGFVPFHELYRRRMKAEAKNGKERENALLAIPTMPKSSKKKSKGADYQPLSAVLTVSVLSHLKKS